MERWVVETKEFEERPDIDAFLAEVVSVCQKHGLSIQHEDGHGAFVIYTLDTGAEEWILSAHDGRAPVQEAPNTLAA